MVVKGEVKKLSCGVRKRGSPLDTPRMWIVYFEDGHPISDLPCKTLIMFLGVKFILEK
jgi:hypothetical protein